MIPHPYIGRACHYEDPEDPEQDFDGHVVSVLPDGSYLTLRRPDGTHLTTGYIRVTVPGDPPTVPSPMELAEAAGKAAGAKIVSYIREHFAHGHDRDIAMSAGSRAGEAITSWLGAYVGGEEKRWHHIINKLADRIGAAIKGGAE